MSKIMKQLTVETVLEIIALKEQAQALYDQIDERLQVVVAECGPGRYDFDLEELSPGERDEEMLANGRWLKFEVVDNAARLLSGEPIWKSFVVKPYSFSSGFLKRRPASLRDK